MRKFTAFSLVELLVVMAIIATLMGLAIFGISAVQKNARDTERMVKVQEISTKLSRIRLNGGTLPDHFKWGDVSATHIVINNERINLNGGVQRMLPDQDLGVIQTTNSATDYCYTPQGTYFVIGVKLESGDYYYQTNTSATYSNSTSFYSDPESGSGPKCIDGNL